MALELRQSQADPDEEEIALGQANLADVLGCWPNKRRVQEAIELGWRSFHVYCRNRDPWSPELGAILHAIAKAEQYQDPCGGKVVEHALAFIKARRQRRLPDLANGLLEKTLVVAAMARFELEARWLANELMGVSLDLRLPHERIGASLVLCDCASELLGVGDLLSLDIAKRLEEHAVSTGTTAPELRQLGVLFWRPRLWNGE